uniref:Ig-like domain-containing protein n=1 Tax=Oryzias sinensis TaxID=183150 RepID=A0A8C8DNN2_9TELE
CSMSSSCWILFSTGTEVTLDITVKSGEMAKFSCLFNGHPFTGVAWDHDGQNLVDTERVRSSQSGGLLSLVIHSVSVADQGKYCCIATNPHGQDRDLNLFISPEILIKLPPDLQTTNGPTEAQYRAMIQLPTLLDIWLFRHLNIKDSDLYSSKHDGPLCFKNAYNAQTGEMGSYSCKAVSSVPNAECSRLMKGWHLHAFGPSSSSDFVRPTHHYS